MYSPTMRRLAVLELLETYRSISGVELARRLEVHPRTVRRYIESLQDMGISIVGERGPHGSYRLERGSRLPPLMFGDSEAAALIFGLQAIRALGFPVDPSVVEGAKAKIERLLPENILGYVKELQSLVGIQRPDFFSGSALPRGDFVHLLAKAISNQQRISLIYASSQGQKTQREVDLYGLTWWEGRWYSVGFCHLRKGLRVFRINRIVSFQTSSQNFERPKDFDTLGFIAQKIGHKRQIYQAEILLKVPMESARGLLPEEAGSLVEGEEGVLYRPKVSRLDWLAFALVQLRIPLEIRQPPELLESLKELSWSAQQLYQSNSPD